MLCENVEFKFKCFFGFSEMMNEMDSKFYLKSLIKLCEIKLAAKCCWNFVILINDVGFGPYSY